MAEHKKAHEELLLAEQKLKEAQDEKQVAHHELVEAENEKKKVEVELQRAKTIPNLQTTHWLYTFQFGRLPP